LVKVISGCTKVRFESQINHRQYCQRWGYEYIWDEKPRELKSPYDHKLYALLDLPIDNNWWFWVDDDAFFTQIDTPLEKFVEEFDKRTQFVFAKSPINPKGGWTYLSSGNFFFKSSKKVHRFLKSVLASDLLEIKEWWNPETLGLFTKGDQDKIVYQLFKQPRIMKRTSILPYDTFNFRPYHFEKSFNEHFLSHFAVPGVAKVESIEEFRARFNFPDSSLTMPYEKSL
jgi:hypothetical protein